MKHYVDKPDYTLKAVIRAAFPSYQGRKVTISDQVPSVLRSYWDGGSRDYYAFVSLETLLPAAVPSNHPYYEAGAPRDLPGGLLPENLVLVQHSILCGKDAGITVYVGPANLAKMLPSGTGHETTRYQSIVLAATRSLKACYGGDSDIRFREAHRYTGITRDAWDNARRECQDAGLLDKRGAITAAGRNVIGSTLLSTLRDSDVFE